MRVLATVLALIFVTTLCAVNAYRPGTCTKQKRGKFIVVKDRNGDDNIAVCIQRHGNYQWHVINDVNTVLTYESCKQILMSGSNNESGVYQISVGNNKIDVYCQMTSVSGCHGGGWTMVMKIDGSSSTFNYGSSYWTSKNTYNDKDYGRNGGLDSRQYKGSTYWRTSFNEICVGMNYSGYFRAFSFSYPASSLYDLIADGNYRQTRLGRSQWRRLIYKSSLQRNCNKEGFNVHVQNIFIKVRLGLIANQENDCNTPDSFIGLGADSRGLCGYNPSSNAAGNLAQCRPDNGNKNAKAMGYILVR